MYLVPYAPQAELPGEYYIKMDWDWHNRHLDDAAMIKKGNSKGNIGELFNLEYMKVLQRLCDDARTELKMEIIPPEKPVKAARTTEDSTKLAKASSRVFEEEDIDWKNASPQSSKKRNAPPPPPPSAKKANSQASAPR